MSNQGTIRLKVTNGAPAIEKLWNGRFKLEFFCDNNSPKEDWYYDNIGAILPDYGILQEANFGSGVSEDWEAIPASVYPDMRLVLAEYPYNVRAGKHYVKLTYETLTSSWVEEKDEDTDYELNGLKRVSRTFVALPDTAYDKVVGTSTIDSNGTTLYLGSFKIEETDAKWSLSEIWLEAGELSREENLEDARGSISITRIGGCPAAPTGYTVVSESKNNTQGFETCSRTFYKDGSVLSRSNDYVGSQLAETIEVFRATAEPTPTNPTAVLGSKSESNVGGIPTSRYTFLRPSILSVSEDFASPDEVTRVVAFLTTEAEALVDLGLDTTHVLVDSSESDYEGLKTSSYTFSKTASVDIIDFDLNGLMRVTTTTRDQSTPLFGQDIGVSSRTVNGTVVYLAQLNIISAIKNEETYVWIEAGIADESESIVGDGLRQVDRISFKYENVPSVGVVVFKKQTNYNGYPMWNTSTIQLFDGSAPDSAVASSYSSFVPFTYPGVASLVGFPNAAITLEAPVTAEIEATIQISYQTSNSIGSLDYPLWSPIEWAYLQSSWTEQESWTTPTPNSRSYGYSRGGSKNQALPGYRSGANSSLNDSAFSGPVSVFGQALLNRTRAFADSSSASATVTANLTGGPTDPTGKTYTIQTPVLEEAFSDIDGTKYYRKTLITAIIPSIGGQGSTSFNGVTIENGDSNPTTAKGTSFGAVPVGDSVTRTFQVTNTGVSDLVLGSPSVSSNQFAVSGLNTTVSPGSTATLTVTYTAISGAPGLRTGAISYDQGISGSFTFAIDWISEL